MKAYKSESFEKRNRKPKSRNKDSRLLRKDLSNLLFSAIDFAYEVLSFIPIKDEQRLEWQHMGLFCATPHAGRLKCPR
jgi:hypothetical protein